MKFFYQVITVTFTSVGAVIGAGFLTGRELVAFFGVEGYTLFTALSFFSIFLSFSFIYITGRNYRSLTELNGKLFKNPAVFNLSVIIASFISVCGMIAGINALFSFLGKWQASAISLSVLVLSALLSKKGVRGAEKASLIAVPVIIALTFFLVLKKGEFDFSYQNKNLSLGIIKTVFYTCMNVFINLPVLVDVSFKKSKKALITAAFITAFILSFLSVLILGTVKSADSKNAEMPLFIALGGAPLFLAALFFAMFSSAISAFYPVYGFAKEKAGKGGQILSVAAVFAVSLIGLKGIVDYMYPLIGAFGFIYLLKCIFYRFKGGIKNEGGRIIQFKFHKRRKGYEKEKQTQNNAFNRRTV